MAQNTALKKIHAEAKRIRKKHPHKYDRIRNPWARGYIVEAAKKYNHGGLKRKKKVSGVPKKKPHKRKVVKKKPAAKKKPVKRGRAVVKYVEKKSTERVMAGRRHKRHKKPAEKSRRRRVSGTGVSTGTLMGIGVGLLALYLITKKPVNASNPVTLNTPLPPLAQTGNYTRDQQSQSIVNYAIATGLALDAVIKLIDRLNQSDDQDVGNIYDRVNTTGEIGIYA